MAFPRAVTDAVQRLEKLPSVPLEPGPGTATEAYKINSPLAYTLSQMPLGTARPLKIICIGAGFSGLAFAREVETKQLQNINLTVYEKNSEVGGTWWENRYPGCACDIPIHNYQYSWAPYPHFPSYYAAQKDIHAYMSLVADQHNLRQYVRTSHKVLGAKWIAESQKWEVQVVCTDGRELMTSNRYSREGEKGEPFIEECDVLINGSGCFNDWKWPNITNREGFRGELIHSAIWPRDANLKSKRVALIGNGSTGVQILPAILDEVESVKVYIRSRTWVTAGFAQRFAGPNGTNVVFSDEQKKAWQENPEEYLKYRKDVESELNSRFRLYLKYSQEQKDARAFSIDQMTAKLSGKPEIVDKLLPDFSVGCRRATPGNGYLEALCSPKVEIVWGEIDSFDDKGIKSATGAYNEFDTIICATGFNMSFSPRFPIIGEKGIDLQKKWDKNPECYLSVTAANMPNYFMYLGPGSPLGHGSVVSSLERVTEYMSRMISKLQKENYSSVVPKPHIPRAYQKQALAWLEKTAWSSNCVSTYKNGDPNGPLISLHPGSRLHFFELLKNPRFEDFDWQSLCDDQDLTFAWMANGFTVDEENKENTKDLTWFLPSVEKAKFIQKPETNGGKVHTEEVEEAQLSSKRACV
ncbi:putative sterigmatocystin biosynthesis monooxygenase [Lachnellula arida]|uniref:Putative sterigmatocystin biosynthesis monooxygenase n=1 Tax=Lachnellula arida TaxID=1316785 RepID=A0A8T9BDF4_9HELO|nr:putative sterigmatocystin biosynthesis monooxygenase [Lachnellula arida]